MKMKMKLFSSLLFSILCAGFMSAAVLAAGNDSIDVNGVTIQINQDYSAACGGGTVSYEADTHTITLDNITLTSSAAQTFIYSPGTTDINVVLKNSNTLSVNTGIFVNGNLNISGTGNLNITSESYGLYSGGNLTVDGVNLQLASMPTSIAPLLNAQSGTLTIKNCPNIEVSNSSGRGIQGGNAVIIDNSTVTSTVAATSGIYSAIWAGAQGFQITNSKVNASSSSGNGIETYSSSSSISSSQMNVASGGDWNSAIIAHDLVIQGSTVIATSPGAESNGIYCDSSLSISDHSTVIAKGTYPALFSQNGTSINNSSVTATATDDIAVFSRKDIVISGSTIKAEAPAGSPGMKSNGSNASIDGSWIESTGAVTGFSSTTDSVLIEGTQGTVVGNAVVSGQVVIPANTTLTIPEGTSLMNKGTITNKGTIILDGLIEGTSIANEDTGIITHSIHNWSGTWSQNAEAHWYECTKDNCMITNNSQKGSYAKHNLKWIVDREPTAGMAGSKHEECETCGYKNSAIEIPALDETPTSPEITEPEGSSSTGTPTAPKKGDTVTSLKTGDENCLALWLSLLILTGSVLSGIIIYRQKQKYCR